MQGLEKKPETMPSEIDPPHVDDLDEASWFEDEREADQVFRNISKVGDQLPLYDCSA